MGKYFIAALISALWDKDPSEYILVDDVNYIIDSLYAFEYSFEPDMSDIIEMR